MYMYTVPLVVYFLLHTQLRYVQCTHCFMCLKMYAVLHVYMSVPIVHLYVSSTVYSSSLYMQCTVVHSVHAVYRIYESGRSCDVTTTSKYKLNKKKLSRKLRVFKPYKHITIAF